MNAQFPSQQVRQYVLVTLKPAPTAQSTPASFELGKLFEAVVFRDGGVLNGRVACWIHLGRAGGWGGCGGGKIGSLHVVAMYDMYKVGTHCYIAT